MKRDKRAKQIVARLQGDNDAPSAPRKGVREESSLHRAGARQRTEQRSGSHRQFKPLSIDYLDVGRCQLVPMDEDHLVSFHLCRFLLGPHGRDFRVQLSLGGFGVFELPSQETGLVQASVLHQSAENEVF